MIKMTSIARCFSTNSFFNKLSSNHALI